MPLVGSLMQSDMYATSKTTLTFCFGFNVTVTIFCGGPTWNTGVLTQALLIEVTFSVTRLLRMLVVMISLWSLRFRTTTRTKLVLLVLVAVSATVLGALIAVTARSWTTTLAIAAAELLADTG